MVDVTVFGGEGSDVEEVGDVARGAMGPSTIEVDERAEMMDFRFESAEGAVRVHGMVRALERVT